MAYDYENDPRETDELLRLLQRPREDAERSRALCTLHYRATDATFAAGVELCVSSEPHARVAGADLLGQLGWERKVRCSERTEVLHRLLKTETDPDVLCAVCIALSHVSSGPDDPRDIVAILRHRKNPHSCVRYGVVHGLSNHADPHAIAGLLELSADADTDVRNWATFYLGYDCVPDSTQLRAAFWARMQDADGEVRGEALKGLANLKDPGALKAIQTVLAADEPDDDELFFAMALNAAEMLGDPRLVPLLERLRITHPFHSYLNDALKACSEFKE